MNDRDRAYAEGFVQKCATLGLDPRRLIKRAADVGATLNKLLASEIRAWWTYYIGAQLTEGKSRTVIAKEFEAHAAEELGHAEALITRLQELGLPVTANLAKIVSDSKADAQVPIESAALLKLNAELEATAIDDYTAAIAAVKDSDPATALMLTQHLQTEQEHHHDIEQLATELDLDIKTAQATGSLPRTGMSMRVPHAPKPAYGDPAKISRPLPSMRVPHAPGVVRGPDMAAELARRRSNGMQMRPQPQPQPVAAQAQPLTIRPMLGMGFGNPALGPAGQTLL